MEKEYEYTLDDCDCRYCLYTSMKSRKTAVLISVAALRRSKRLSCGLVMEKRRFLHHPC